MDSVCFLVDVIGRQFHVVKAPPVQLQARQANSPFSTVARSRQSCYRSIMVAPAARSHAWFSASMVLCLSRSQSEARLTTSGEALAARLVRDIPRDQAPDDHHGGLDSFFNGGLFRGRPNGRTGVGLPDGGRSVRLRGSGYFACFAIRFGNAAECSSVSTRREKTMHRLAPASKSPRLARLVFRPAAPRKLAFAPAASSSSRRLFGEDVGAIEPLVRL